ncbi:polysaccharide deacetylase family protein [Rubrobacter indicoceani]|uniref:polysaccharide deacetylase family protein n=1 Tax=Rubrobacter indicoceani TaxID=2051957 RepID=UPI000E5B29DD|nr:polysaccharide deacetylase family protein [Rubrobacter indicoceani]
MQGNSEVGSRTKAVSGLYLRRWKQQRKLSVPVGEVGLTEAGVCTSKGYNTEEERYGAVDRRTLKRPGRGAQYGSGAVYLTFDDGPDPVWTPQVLDALDAGGARATFFVITPLAGRYPHLVERMISGGHAVALHCVRHIRHTALDAAEILADAEKGLGDLAALGVKTRNWRPPWGVVTEGTREAARTLGLELRLWSEDTHDWRGDPAAGMLESIAPGLAGGSVVLMHDGLGPGATRRGCPETLALIPALLESIRERRLSPAAMGAAVGAQVGAQVGPHRETRREGAGLSPA